MEGKILCSLIYLLAFFGKGSALNVVDADAVADEDTSLTLSLILDNIIESSGNAAGEDSGISTRTSLGCPPSKICGPGELCAIYSGNPTCFDPSTPCLYMPCRNGGTCSLNNKCICLPGYTGHHCTDSICLPGTCLNGGVCRVASIYPGFTCECPPGYSGFMCDESACYAGYCEHGGLCVPSISGDLSCINCNPGYTGKRCETSPCDRVLCRNGGTCLQSGVTFLCNCLIGFGGSYCEEIIYTATTQTNVDNPVACSSEPCSGDCACVESCQHEMGYICLSTAGYLGRHCDIEIPTLICNENAIIVEVSRQFYEEFDENQKNSYLYVSPTVDGDGSAASQCRAEIIDGVYKITIPHPYTQCGGSAATEVGVDGAERVVFQNKVWINKKFGVQPDFYDMPMGVIGIQCIYSNLYSVYTSIQPLVDEQNIFLMDELEYSVTSTLCKVSTCVEECPADLSIRQSALYTVGQIVHLGFQITPLLDTALDQMPPKSSVIEYLVLSCSSTLPVPGDPQTVPLFTEGCPTEYGSSLTSASGSSTLASSAVQNLCASFRLPRSKTCTELFVHVLIRVCVDQTATVTCPDGSSVERCLVSRKRSVTKNSQKSVVVGPIFLLGELDKGKGHVTMMVDGRSYEMHSEPKNGTHMVGNKPELEKFSLQTASVQLLAVMCGIILTFVVFAVIGIIFIKRKLCVEYQHKINA